MREYGSEHHTIVLPDGYFESLGKYDRDVIFLRSGREALLLAAISIGEKQTILLPAYCCWSMSVPFEKAGYKIIYYRLNEDLTIDLDYLNHLLVTEKPHVILTMNFYGSSFTNYAIENIKKFSDRIIVIEDFSHCTFSFKQIYNTKVDIYISSIRKSVGICDGAVILSKLRLKKESIIEDLTDFSEIRYKAQKGKAYYKWSNNQHNKCDFLLELRKGESIINEFNNIYSISKRASYMLRLINSEEIAYARRENMKHLIQLLKDKVRMLPGVERALAGAPFSLPILLDNRDILQSRFSKLGLYAPVLWPINEDAQKVCEVSKAFAEQMLSIPIDQRYDWNDIEQIAEIIINNIQ